MLKGLIFACIAALFWGILPIALKFALIAIDPLTIIWFRFFMAFSLLFILLRIKTNTNLYILNKPPPLLLLAGFCLGLNYWGFIKGVQLTTPANAEVLVQLAPLLFLLAGIFVFKEKVTILQISGLLLAGSGFITFYRDQLFQLIQQEYNTGVLWIIFAAVTWLFYAIIQKQMVSKYPAQMLNLIIYGVPVLMFFPFADFAVFTDLSLNLWLLLLFLGFNTLIAYGCLTEAFKYAPANKISVILALNPLITIFLMTLMAKFELNWLPHEKITLTGFIGALMVISGAILAVLTPSKREHLK